MYYLTTYWFSVRNSDSYLLRKKHWTAKPFVPLRHDYHCTNITHMNFIRVIPFQPQQSLYAVFLHVTAAHTHTHVHFTFHTSTVQNLCSFFQRELRYSTTQCWTRVCFAQCHHESPTAVTRCHWKHTQPHCFSQVYRCSLHGNRLLLSQILLSLYVFWNRKLHRQSYEKNPCCEDPNRGR